MKGRSTAVLEGDAERAAWEQHQARPWTSPGAIIRAGWLPSDLESAAFGLELIGRAATGAGLLRLDGDSRSQAAAIEQLRRSTTLRNVVIVRGSDELKSLVDVWGPMGDREKLFASLKRTLDPHGVLNAGRGPL